MMNGYNDNIQELTEIELNIVSGGIFSPEVYDVLEPYIKTLIAEASEINSLASRSSLIMAAMVQSTSSQIITYLNRIQKNTTDSEYKSIMRNVYYKFVWLRSAAVGDPIYATHLEVFEKNLSVIKDFG